jgi:hypothetical protein
MLRVVTRKGCGAFYADAAALARDLASALPHSASRNRTPVSGNGGRDPSIDASAARVAAAAD